MREGHQEDGGKGSHKPSFLTRRQKFNNTHTYFFCEKSRFQLNGRRGWDGLESSYTEAGRKICGTLSPQFLLLAQCYVIKRKMALSSSQGGKEKRSDYVSNVLTFWGGVLSEALTSLSRLRVLTGPGTAQMPGDH